MAFKEGLGASAMTPAPPYLSQEYIILGSIFSQMAKSTPECQK